jgi:hypothetical protein
MGGTGVDGSSQSANKVLASPSSGTGAVSFRSLVAADIPDLSTSKLTTGTLGVARGGTGKISHTVNSVIIGGISATGALQNVTSAKGAFYSTGSNKKPTFGTLPVAQGGTGMTTTTNVNAVVIGNSSDAANAMQTVAAASGAFYATGANAKPQFGTLPVAQGGTGVNGSSQAINKVLASPASGSAGAISFRSLTVADLPTGTTSSTIALGNHTHNSLKSSNSPTVFSTLQINDSGDVYLTANDGAAVLQAPAPRSAGYTLVKILGTESGIQTQQAHKVLAGPSSGTNGVVSFRTLVASDLPAHTHTSLQSGSYTATPPTLTADKTLAITDDLNILPITTSTALSITMTADKYMYKVTDSGATGTFPTLTAPTGLPADCYYKFEMEWVTASPTATYSQTASTTPAMKWITSPVMQTDGLTHTYHISGRYDTTTSTFWMSCWKIDDAQGAITPDSHMMKYLLTTPEQVVSTTTDTNDTITVQLSDHAINTVQVPTTATNVVMKFPGQAVGKARDFMVRLVVTGETVPSITLTEPDGSAVEFDVDDDSWTEIEQGVNLLMFTETAQ